MLTPLVEKKILEQSEELGIREDQVVKEVLLAETVEKQFTTVEDIAEVRLVPGRIQDQCVDGAIDLRQPRLAYELTAAAVSA